MEPKCDYSRAAGRSRGSGPRRQLPATAVDPPAPNLVVKPIATPTPVLTLGRSILDKIRAIERYQPVTGQSWKTGFGRARTLPQAITW